MPIYEFQCQACGEEIEVLQKISDPNPTDCEACGKPELTKKVTAAAFRLSGAGWYETDFKAGDKKKNLTESGDSKKTKDTKDKAESKTSEKSASDNSKSTVKDSGSSSKKGSTKSTD